jgi:tRNA-2-methylthio-N6-dimethylallyladenosine synthase
MRYAITTFGCQMNVHDSERLGEVLRGAGLVEVATPADAEVVVLNTCSVREKAEQKLRSEVGRLAVLKRERPDLLVVVAGCVAQQEGDKLLRSLRAVDVVVGPDNLAELPELLEAARAGAPPAVRTVFDLDAPRFLSATGAGGAATAYVTVMKGCDERCSFCIVPHTRGPERYRPSREIVAEVATLVAAGVREVTLLGQTVNSYTDPLGELPPAPGVRPDDPDESQFAALLRAIAEAVPALLRLRYTSPHPRHVTPSLVRAHAELAVLPRHVHLPVQSGSDRMLKRMIRRYDREEYVARARALQSAAAGLTLSTDVIVGFPGETEDDFLATLSLVREVGFTGLFGFKYSPRPYTPALKLGDDVSEEEKSSRLARLFEVSEQLLGAHLETLVGSTQQVLIEGPSKAGAASAGGRTERNEIVHVSLGDAGAAVAGAAHALTGRVVAARITRANRHSLLGELGEVDRARLAALPGTSVRPATRRVLPVVAP